MKLTRRELLRLLAAVPMTALVAPDFVTGIKRSGEVSFPINWDPNPAPVMASGWVPATFKVSFPDGTEFAFAGLIGSGPGPFEGCLELETEGEQTLYVRPEGPMVIGQADWNLPAERRPASGTLFSVNGEEICELRDITPPDGPSAMQLRGFKP